MANSVEEGRQVDKGLGYTDKYSEVECSDSCMECNSRWGESEKAFQERWSFLFICLVGFCFCFVLFFK